MKLSINVIIFSLLVLMSVLINGSIAQSNVADNIANAKKIALRNLAKIFAANVIEKLESNINFENEVLKEIQKKNLQRVVKRISTRVARKVVKTAKVTNIIRAAANGKIINLKKNLNSIPQNTLRKVQKTMVANLSNNQIKKVLNNVQQNTGSLNENTKMRIIHAIREAFEDAYINNPSAISQELHRSVPAVAPIINNLKKVTKNGTIKNILKDSKLIQKIQFNKAQRNDGRINKANKSIKQASVKVNIQKVLRKVIPAKEKKEIKKIINKINKIKKIESLIRKEIVKPNKTTTQIRKLIKTLHKIKKVQKILENKKNEKISKHVMKTAKQAIVKAKILRNKLAHTKDIHLKQQIKKQIIKEIKKAKALIKIEKKINNAIKKNVIATKKLDVKIARADKILKKINVPVFKKINKVNKNISGVHSKVAAAQKVKKLVAKIEKKLIQANCNPAGVKVLLRSLKKESVKVVKNISVKNSNVNKNVQKNLLKKVNAVKKAVPRVLTSFDAKNVAKKINKNLIKTKNISPKKIEKISEAISKKIIKNAVTLQAAKKLAIELVKKANANPKSTKAGKKLIQKIAQKIIAKIVQQKVKAISKGKALNSFVVAKIQNKIPCNITPKKAVKVAQQIQNVLANKKVSRADINKFSQKIANKILQSAANPKAAQKVVNALVTRIFRDRKATKDSKNIAAKVAQAVMKSVKAVNKKNNVVANIGKKAAIVAKAVPVKLTVRKAAVVAKKIEKNIVKIQKKASDAQIKKVSSKIAEKIIKNATSVKAAKKVIANLIKKIIRNPKASTAAKKTVSEIATKVISKLQKIKNKN